MILTELATSIGAEFTWELGVQAFRRDKRGNLRRRPVLGSLSALLIGALLACVVSLFFPTRILPQFGIAGASLLLFPVLSAWTMHRYGQWAEARGRPTSFIASALGGAAFAFGFAATRLAFVTIGAAAA
jgi:MFS family permease